MSLSADARLRRILALIPWVEAQGSAAVEEVCARFGFTEEELQADLELLFLCGVPPYSPGDLIDAQVHDGRVSISYADWFRRPLRLTAAQALVLLTAAEALLSVPGTDGQGPLARALDKVAEVVGVEPGDRPEVELGDVDEAALGVLRNGVTGHRSVRVEHYSAGADRWAERTIDPWLVFSQHGAWYVRAHCHLARAPRVFRVDRMRAVSPTETTFEPPADTGGTEVFEHHEGGPTVVLDVAPDARWVAATYPHDGVTDLEDGWQRVVLPVGERAWLERLLLALGPNARVVDAPEGLVDAGPGAAARILSRYR